MSSEVIDDKASASGYLMHKSILVRRYLFLDFVVVRGPTKSIETMENGIPLI